MDRTSLYDLLGTVAKGASTLLLWTSILLTVQAQAALDVSLDIQAKNSMDDQPLANLDVYAFEKDPEGQLSWRQHGVTDSQGGLTLTLPGLGSGATYVLASIPYNGGIAFSDDITDTGTYQYKLGALEVTVINGNDNSILVNHEVAASEVLQDGTTEVVALGDTDSSGVIRFDLPGLGSGRNYYLHSTRPHDGSYFAGEELAGDGYYQFKIGHPLLHASVTDSFSGAPFADQMVHLFQKPQGGDLIYLASRLTDNEGKVDFELEDQGHGVTYQLITDAFNGMSSYSEPVTGAGDFSFKVGQLKVTALSGADGALLANYTVGAMERMPDGSDTWAAEGTTDNNGTIRFDLAGLGQGRNYVLYASSPLDGSVKKSVVLNANGEFSFNVGSQPLQVTLANGLDGEPVAEQLIVVLSVMSDGSFDAISWGTTDSNGSLSLDIDVLGAGQEIVLVTAYKGSWVFSDTITEPGSTQFVVGRLAVRLRDTDSGQNLPGQTLTLMEKLPNGELSGVTQGTTDSEGVATFDSPDLVDGGSYTVLADNVFGQNKRYFSHWIGSSGQFDFLVSLDGDHMFDDMLPELELLSPAQGQNVSAAGFIVEGTATDNQALGSLVIEVVDDQLGTHSEQVSVLEGQWSYLVPGSALSTGSSISLTVRAYDQMGNESVAQVGLNTVADASAPQLIVNSHTDQGTVSSAGFLLTGTATDNLGLQQLTATLIHSNQGELFQDYPLSVAPNSGNWALPVTPVAAGGQLQLTIVARDFDGHESSANLELNVVEAAASVEHVISRITFGATPALLDETRGQEADTFKEQQLDWASIDDSELEAMLTSFPDPTTLYELQDYQLMRAIFSKRQLLEKMAWFWENHFSTDLGKSGHVPHELEENRLFRTHALGKFRDLLQSSATSPAMLIYLDNLTNIRTEPNENYARELMELHTVGIGGYSETDVTEVARVLTGWSVQDDKFHVFDEVHDPGEKTILGDTFGSDSALDDGNQLLDILASHPSTANHICTKLVEYLVTDQPASSSVNDCADVFLSSGGDIREVVSSILDSPAFSAPTAFKSKAKSPMEFLVGMIRGLSPTMSYMQTRYFLDSMGMPTFRCKPPTGWPESGADWINADQIAQRISAVSALLFNPPGMETFHLANPREMFLARGLESEDAVLGRMAELTLSGRYAGPEWEEAKKALAGGSAAFDIHADDADYRLREAMAVMFNKPEYHLQ